MRFSAPRTLCVIALVLALTITACNKSTPTNAPDATDSPAHSSPLASPIETSPEAQVNEIPTPASDSGVVTGVLIHHTFQSPLVNKDLYLGPVLKSEDGQMEAVRLVAESAPVATTDSEGRFVFADVEPGRYGIVLGGALNDYLLADFRTQEEILISVEAGQTVDLQEIWIVPPEE